jgi:hypothetical protein
MHIFELGTVVKIYISGLHWFGHLEVVKGRVHIQTHSKVIS